MADDKAMSPEEVDELFVTKYLGLPKDASLEDISRVMKFFADAQDDINRTTFHGEVLPTDEWSIKLLEMSRTADGTIFWYLFYQYDARHHNGKLREEGLSRVRVVGEF